MAGSVLRSEPKLVMHKKSIFRVHRATISRIAAKARAMSGEARSVLSDFLRRVSEGHSRSSGRWSPRHPRSAQPHRFMGDQTICPE
jgi:hypothetical protein